MPHTHIDASTIRYHIPVNVYAHHKYLLQMDIVAHPDRTYAKLADPVVLPIYVNVEYSCQDDWQMQLFLDS